MRNMSYNEIVTMIRENENLQRVILNDPSLREQLIAKYGGMKHSMSDHSLYSSKYGDRRTHGNTQLYATPRRSEEGMGKLLCI